MKQLIRRHEPSSDRADRRRDRTANPAVAAELRLIAERRRELLRLDRS